MNQLDNELLEDYFRIWVEGKWGQLQSKGLTEDTVEYFEFYPRKRAIEDHWKITVRQQIMEHIVGNFEYKIEPHNSVHFEEFKVVVK